MKEKFLAIRYLLFILCLFFLTCRQLPKKVSKLVPEELCGMKKTIILEGEAAIEDVKRKHIGKIENVQDIAIVNYGPPRHPILLWITLYPNRKIAYVENEKMAKAMQKYGNNWGKNLTLFTVEKRKVYCTSPDGLEEHYFWVEKNYIFYVRIPQIFQGKFAEIMKELKK